MILNNSKYCSGPPAYRHYFVFVKCIRIYNFGKIVHICAGVIYSLSYQGLMGSLLLPSVSRVYKNIIYKWTTVLRFVYKYQGYWFIRLYSWPLEEVRTVRALLGCFGNKWTIWEGTEISWSIIAWCSLEIISRHKESRGSIRLTTREYKCGWFWASGLYVQWSRRESTTLDSAEIILCAPFSPLFSKIEEDKWTIGDDC